jgi:hypothetical protein
MFYENVHKILKSNQRDLSVIKISIATLEYKVSDEHRNIILSQYNIGHFTWKHM